MLDTFLFMGCWNKDGCQSSKGQLAVAKAIRKEPGDYPLFLGGDNIYPDKGEQKIYPPERILQGIHCLIRDDPRPLYAAIGNHNLPLLPLQLDSPWILPAPSYHVEYKNCSILVLDSNPLDAGELYGLDALEIELDELQKKRKPYYLIMHHPIVSYKKKKIQVLPQHAPLLDLLISYPPLFLLVADTHNYQKGIIQWKGQSIVQIVSGTGGADLDTLESIGTPIHAFEGSYRVLEAAISYGYQRIRGDYSEFVEIKPSK